MESKNEKKEWLESDCSPFSSLYCNLKIRLTGNLNEKNLSDLYNCNLCNQCGLAGVNQSAREKAVNKNLIMRHVAEIRENIREYGNSYGETPNYLNPTSKEKITKTILFRGCTPLYKTPEILESVENLLKSQNIEYEFMNDENCCGNILFNLGDNESAQELVRENIAKLKKSGVKRIITVCPGCYNAFNKYYVGENGFNVEVILAIDLLSNLTISNKNYVVQESCHGREKTSEVIKVFTNSKEITKNLCCGAGAGVLAYNEKMAASKANDLIKNNSQKIVTYCPFCYINLSAYSTNIFDIYVLLDSQYNNIKIID
ncbi:(Fe-S)-binding protein [Methanobacterium alcaliphilum]|uniref:(Fe-S)-binding protein n=1 Tax=Methanobacterium alcaliphilum TaxID=392018 RepID=UPI00200A8599|nr:(Fe-S)-binding protein [Methanobacterium alcaliphilum]MCK9150455.1 (Fe-S)-binding protein [Methanobacterium alcaliphilum]